MPSTLARAFAQTPGEKSGTGRLTDAPFIRTPQPTQGYTQSFPYAINPSFIRLLRLVLYTVTSLSAIVTAVFAILVVAWYNGHEPVIKPSWGSDIALIVFGLGTPGPLFATLLLAPRMVRRGGVAAALVGQVRSELFLLFNLCVIWISGALAMAVDLRGYENCIWDGYYHWPKPSDFNHVCDLINTTVILGYVTFGLVALQWAVVTAIATYILLYLDQDVLTEPAHDMGGRAYRAHMLALSLAADRPGQMYDEKAPMLQPSSPVVGGPMSGGRWTMRVPQSASGAGGPPSSPGPMAGGRPIPGTGGYVDDVPRSPTRHRANSHEFDEEGLAHFASRPSQEVPRGMPEQEGYYGGGANPFARGGVEYGRVE